MLAHFTKSMKKKDEGFTLIELLVVIVIIGILAAIAIPVFLNQRKKGVDASIKSDLANMAISEETWLTDNPTGTGGVANGGVTYPTPPTGVTGVTFQGSPNNTITVTLAATPLIGYCIKGYNPGASTAISAATALMYDSLKGGPITATSAGGAC